MENSLNNEINKSPSSKNSATAVSNSDKNSSLQLASTPEASSTTIGGVKLLQTIKFNIIEGAEDLAQVRLVLCNLTQTSLKFRLKSNQNDAVTCSPNSFGTIKPKDNFEVLLSWYQLPQYNTWIDVPPLKMIIESCLDSKNPEEEEESRAAIKFLGAVSTAEPCKPENIPKEQLLLDSRLGNYSEKTRKGTRKNNSESKSHKKSNEDKEELTNNMLYLLFFLFFLLFINYGLAKK
uniref:MSP domain-containing protein n=1 Tax=Strongyloides stercoralis TaxID=6248 RepID=A0AAF5I0F0_STRER